MNFISFLSAHIIYISMCVFAVKTQCDYLSVASAGVRLSNTDSCCVPATETSESKAKRSMLHHTSHVQALRYSAVVIANANNATQRHY